MSLLPFYKPHPEHWGGPRTLLATHVVAALSPNPLPLLGPNFDKPKTA